MSKSPLVRPPSGATEVGSRPTYLSPTAAATRPLAAMYCLAKWIQPTWQIPREKWTWKVSLRPQQREAPLNRTGPVPPRHTTMQLCPYMVAARLMTMLWPGHDTPTQGHPHLTEEDMPGIKQCFFSTLDCLQQAQPHILKLKWTAPG